MTEREKFIDYVDTMHRQNLNGREDFIEAFQLGINAAYEERSELVKESDSLPCVSMRDLYGELRMMGLSPDNCDKIIEWSKTL